MRKLSTLIHFIIVCLLLFAQKGHSQNNPYKAPLYWNPYEYNLATNDYIPEDEWKKNIDWVNDNLKSHGYNMICIDGWGDDSKYNKDGYRTTHSSNWIHDYKYWSDYLKTRGMTLGMYNNPLWINKKAADAGVKIKGTNIPLSTLLNPVVGQEKVFNWVQVNNPGAEEYIKGYVQYYADMGVSYLRIDFLAWFQTGSDKGDTTYGPERSTEEYEKALRWIREACDQNNIFLSLVMPELKDNSVSENKYGHMIRINEDLGDGGWARFNNLDRGIRHSWWSQYYNTFDGYTYWSFISGRKKLILDGDFIRLNSMANDAEKKTVISLHLMAGGPLSIADQYNSIGNNISYYQNEEMLALNKDGFVGKPLFTNDPANESSQVWAGQMSNGDWIVGFFNREDTTKNRSLDFNASLGFSGNASVRDLWTHTDLGSMSSYSVDVPPHGCVILKVVPTNLQPESLSGNTYFIKSKIDGKTIDYTTAKDTLTTANLNWDKLDQKWLITSEKNNEYSITSLSDKKAFDVFEQSTNDGAKIHTWQYLGLNSQKWNIVSNGAGYYKITNVNSNKALEMDAAKGTIVQSNITNSDAQLWSLEPVFDHLTLVGPGSPIGSWTKPEGDATTDFKETKTGTDIWNFTGNLNTGEIKIHAKSGDFVTDDWTSGSWLQAKTANANLLTANEYIVGGTDNRWNIAAAGLYKIKVNFRKDSLEVKRIDYDYMTLTGPGSSTGNWTKPEGDATTDFTETAPNSNIWTYTGNLNAGEIKIHAKLGSDFIADNWLDGSWLHAKAAGADFLSTKDYLIDDSNDYKWNIAEAGYYTVTVNLNTDELTVQRRYFDYVTLTGSGSPTGSWTKPEGDATTDFMETAPNTNIWSFTGLLNAGEIKIHAKLGSDFIGGNWLDGSWLQAKTANADFLTATDYLINNNNDYKWNIAEAGLYNITINLATGLLTVKRMDYDYITLVGPGSSTGSWTKPEGDTATDFTETATNSNIWTFTGNLNAGEIKIHAKLGSDFITNNWDDGNWLYSDEINADFLTATKYRVDGVDGKWKIAEAGFYSITVNLTTGLLIVKRVDCDDVTFSPTGGTYTSIQSVTLSSATEGATVRYTTDGSIPNSSSTVYSGAIELSSTTTIKAYASKSGMTDSAVATALYTINLPIVAEPTFSPAGGTYTSVQSVTLSSATAGASIRYTTDGSTPNSSSTVYSDPINVTESKTIKAYATKYGMADSSISQSIYTINLPPPSPWLHGDIGTVNLTGTALYSSGSFSNTGAGADIEGTADAFHYIYQSISGDVTITARVESLDNTDPWAKAGVMIRSTLDANSKNVFTGITPSNGITFQNRASSGGNTTATAVSSFSAPYWVRIKREGNVVSSFRSLDGVTWTQVGTELTISLGTDVYIGLGVSSHTTAVLATAVFKNVTVTTSTGTVNYKQATNSSKQAIKGDDEVIVSIFPNPAKEFININLTEFKDYFVEIQLTNVTGQILKEEKVMGGSIHEMNTSTLSTGIYLVILKGKGFDIVKKLLIK